MKLSVSVMAHPVRREAVEELLEQLDRPVRVVYDRQPLPSKDPRQRWSTGKRAWKSIDPDSDWGMVIQDDIEVPRDFIAGVEGALTHLPDGGLVSAYTGTGRPDQTSVLRALDSAKRKNLAWATTRSLNWGPAIIMPTAMIPGMLQWCSEEKRMHQNYDFKIGVYFRDVVRWRTWYMVPSLVEHRPMPSLVGHDEGPVRRAHNFLGTDRSALEVDFSRVPAGGLEPTHAVR